MATTIVEPIAEEVVAGSVLIKVEAPEDAKIVEVNFNSGEWNRCEYDSGTGYWIYLWDTKEFANREHTIVARALA